MPIQANNAYVNVHNPAQMGGGVFCGNITVNIGMAGRARWRARVRREHSPRPSARQPRRQRHSRRPSARRRPAVAAAPRPAAAAAALPRTGTGGVTAERSAAWALAGGVLVAVLLGGSGVLAVARRRR
jgi:hypothetical protein